jgi:hypothetical protein
MIIYTGYIRTSYLHAFMGIHMYLVFTHMNRFSQTILSSAAWHAVHILAPPAALEGLESEDRICTSAMACPGRRKSPVEVEIEIGQLQLRRNKNCSMVKNVQNVCQLGRRM